MTVSRNDYRILKTILENKCFTEFHSLTMHQLMEKTNLSYNKIRNTLRVFLAMGLIAEGAVEGNAKTYYILTEGIKKLKQLEMEE